jgi:hypothetical protein
VAETWPSSLPQIPLADSVSYVAHENSIRTQMEAGVAKLRRRYTAVGDDVTLAVMCTRAQVDTLQAFYETTLSVVGVFTWKHFRKPGWPDASYRFKAPPRFAPAGGTVWKAELELERLPATFTDAPATSPSAAQASEAPQNTVDPTISGSTSPGSTLTATAGTWTGVPAPVIVGQWQLKSGGVWTNISGATELNYTTVDLGSHRYKETAKNPAGTGTAASGPITISDAAQTPADSAPQNTAAPVLTGAGNTGDTITTGSGEWTGYPAPTFTYQWQRWGGADWENIAGATATTYTPTEADDYRSAVTATNGSGSATAYSAGVTVTAAQTAPANSVAPEVTGSTTVGGTITTTDGTWTGNPAPTYTYQWQRFTAGAFADIAGATSASYVTADEGDHRCAVTATNAAGSAVAYSNALNIGTAQVAPTLATAPIISGNAYTESTISALPGVWDGSEPITFAYQWQVENGTAWDNVAGATAADYDPPTAGKYRCEVTASNAGGALSAVSNTMSVATAPSGGVTTHYSHDFATTDSWTIPTGCSITGGAFYFNNNDANVTATRDLTTLSLPAGTYTLQADILAGEAGAGATKGNVAFRLNSSTYTTPFFTDTLGTVSAEVTIDVAVVDVEIRVARQDLAMNIKVDNLSVSSGTPAEKPRLDYAPQIIGTPTINETITSTKGVWFGAPEPTYAYAWQKWDGAAWVAAAGTNNAAAYTPTTAGDYRCQVTTTNSAGSTVGTSPSVTVAGDTQGTGTYTQARVLFDAVHGGSEPMVAEMEFRATAAGAALTGTAFASSEAGALTAAGKAFDADANTWWEPALDLDAVPHLGQSFASATAVAQFVMTFPTVESEYTTAAPRTFRLQGWDGAQWTTLKTVTDEAAWTPGETRTYTV